MFDSDYFKRIFPRTLQQKPGAEYYGLLTLTQFMLCIYLIWGYSNFAAMGPYEESNIFKGEMVIVLFFQITMMILERYCARTSDSHLVEKEVEASKRMDFREKDLFESKDEEPYESRYDLTVRHVVQKLKFQDLNEAATLENLDRLSVTSTDRLDVVAQGI